MSYLLGAYLPGDSLLHRAPAGAKLLGLLVFSTLLVVLHGLVATGVLFGIAVAVTLVARLPMLCQRCHIGTRHPSTIYDAVTVRNKSNRIIGRGCVNCHQNIHGSNHPSGHTFLR